MFRLLHLHFESVLRALAVTSPSALTQVHNTFSSVVYQKAAPAQRLHLLENQIQHQAQLTPEAFTESVFTHMVHAFLEELEQSHIEHADLRIGVTTSRWPWMNTIADAIHVFEREQIFFPAISLSFLAALNFAKPLAEIGEILDIVLTSPYAQQAFVGFDINLLPADLPKFVHCVPLLLTAQQQGKKINLHLGELFDNAVSKEILSFLIPHRIGHGVKLLEDEGLVNFLKLHRICLDMCPVSNTRLGVWDWTRDPNPARKALQFGIPTTINTDDPLLFQTTLAQELALANLTTEEIALTQVAGRIYGYKR